MRALSALVRQRTRAAATRSSAAASESTGMSGSGEMLSDRLDRDPGDADVRFLRHAGDVRRQHEVRAVGEDGAAASVEGLFIEDVEGSAPEAVLLQRRRQRSLVDDAAAG